ncbi:reverse transcriptase domain-containing protein [Tanacetum coccineum]
MAEEDKDKTAFYAGEGVFCYKKMSFGLKNAGATYQRLVDKVFSHQIRRNLEAYVDDMVIKSTSKKEMLERYTRNLQKGMRANPSKVKAVTDLDQPRTLKYIQSLNGKLAALNQFLSKGAERSLAFFKVLKGCKDKKSIQWTTEADKALEKMKKLVQALPTLTALRAGETLTIHLAALKENISVVLAAKRNEGWTPIYFIPFEDNEKKEKTKEVPDSSSKWRLYTDGASNSDGSRAGLMLIDPYILSIQVSIVASESAFSASGRILDPYRNALAPNIIEALVCTQDWIRTSSINITTDTLEDLMKDDDLAKEIQEGLDQKKGEQSNGKGKNLAA